ncbi:MAG: YggS family pyridoxal phosphate-dependent enzyme [Planctomycetota bacterium]|jgi:pyridoxal phosphate enzyme (YggS family)
MATASHDPAHTDHSADTLRGRYDAVKERIARAARRSGRAPEDIILVAVTKYASIDQVRQLIEFGQVDLGESRVQQLVQRAAQIDEYIERQRLVRGRGAACEGVRWHMIGHLQRNKARKVLPRIRLVHSLDSLRLAEEIQIAGAKLPEPVEVLVQINVQGDKGKYGVAPAAVRHLVDQIDTMMNIRPRGLMCMAPPVEDPEDSRPVFSMCREIFDDVRRSGSGGEQFDVLSMGMTSDYEVAIECGANIVRVGSAIFGERAETDDEDDGE